LTNGNHFNIRLDAIAQAALSCIPDRSDVRDLDQFWCALFSSLDRRRISLFEASLTRGLLKSWLVGFMKTSHLRVPNGLFIASSAALTYISPRIFVCSLKELICFSINSV